MLTLIIAILHHSKTIQLNTGDMVRT